MRLDRTIIHYLCWKQKPIDRKGPYFCYIIIYAYKLKGIGKLSFNELLDGYGYFIKTKAVIDVKVIRVEDEHV